MIRILRLTPLAAGIFCLLASSAPVVHAAGGPIELAAFCDGSDDKDDTSCIRAWVDAARSSGQELYASPGHFLYRQTVDLFSGAHVRCAGPATTIFRSTGDAKILFDAVGNGLEGISLEDCGFDLNGNKEPFAAVLRVWGQGAAARNIRVRGNRMYDGTLTGKTSPEQRQYILLLNCEQCWVTENHLSEGGRIKVGRPGRRVVIRDNVLEHVNDNAITVVGRAQASSQDILIAGNVIEDPVRTGIFFGADGMPQNDPALSVRNVRISNNVVEGDFVSACIRGTLPNRAEHVVISGNVCSKSGGSGDRVRGIDLFRTHEPSDGSAQLSAKQVLITDNIVTGHFSSAPLYLAGAYDQPILNANQFANSGGGDAIWVRGDVRRVLITNNVYVGSLRVEEPATAVVHDNVEVR